MSNNVKAALWMIGAIASFTSMAVAGRELAPAFDTFEIMFYRSCVGLLVVLIVATSHTGLSAIRIRKFGLHIVRNAAHFAGQNLWFFAVVSIPLAQVFALEFTSPIWAIFLAPLVLGERIRAIQLLAAAIGFAGILFVAQPGAATLSFGLVAAALAAVGFGATAVLTRRLTRTENTISILFFLTTVQLIFGLAAAGYDGDIALPDPAGAPWLLLVGLAGLLAHFCLTSALRLAPAGFIMPIDFARLPLIAIIGTLWYQESVNSYVLLGGLIILFANWLNLTRGNPAP